MKIKLNPDQEVVQTIREGLKRTGGYCPCRIERTEATKCICQEFKEQIAQHISSAREAVARMLKSFSEDGLVELRRGAITLRNADGLHRLK